MAERITDRDRAEVAALADGSLPAQRRAAVEARIAGSPELGGLLARQRTAIQAIRAAGGPAPSALRARIEARTPVRRWRVAAGVGVAAAAAAAVIVLLLPSGAPEAPSVAEAARLAAREPTGPAPGRYDDVDTLLAREVDGIRFPRWAKRFGWPATGERTDRLGGRRAVTVFYARRGHRIAYTIVSGRALREPRARPVVVEGTEFRVVGEQTQVVTWRRKGHTCVLSGRGVTAGSLLALSSWRAGGDLAY
jgi:hypothetical protein